MTYSKYTHLLKEQQSGLYRWFWAQGSSCHFHGLQYKFTSTKALGKGAAVKQWVKPKRPIYYNPIKDKSTTRPYYFIVFCKSVTQFGVSELWTQGMEAGGWTTTASIQNVDKIYYYY